MAQFERIIFFIWTLTSFLTIAENGTFIRKRENLKDEYKQLFGGKSAVSDLVFFDKPNSIKTVNGTPVVLEKTVLKKQKEPMPKDGRQAMRIFARAMKQLIKGRNYDILTQMAKTIGLRLRERRLRKSSSIMEDVLQSENDMGFENEVWQNDIENMENTFHDIQHVLDQSRALNRKKRELWKDIYHQHDGITYTYLNNEACLKKHSVSDSSNTLRLCDICVRQIDFGPSVVPRYANSIECSPGTECLGGDGCCFQKVVYFTFQKSVGFYANGNEKWNTFQQPLNVSCECEVFSVSNMAIYLKYLP